MPALRDWMDANLAIQGYTLEPEDRRRLDVGLRFPTALCLVLVIIALALQSAPMLFALSVLGVVAGFSSRHPFDHLWNGGVRHLLGAPEVPPNPPRRRHAFKVATAWLLLVASLFAAGAGTAGLVLGGMLVAACTAVTLFNLCLPSTALALVRR